MVPEGQSIFLWLVKNIPVCLICNHSVPLGRIQLRSINMQVKYIWVKRTQLKIPSISHIYLSGPSRHLSHSLCSSQNALLSVHTTRHELYYVVTFHAVLSAKSIFSVDLHKACFISSSKSHFKYPPLKEVFSKHRFQ